MNLKDSFTVKEITTTPPTVEELQQMLNFKNGNLKKLFNTSGQLYREMQLNEKLQNMHLNDALKLLSEHGMLVKRPFVIGKNIGLTGFKEAEWSCSL
jgi:arsenate reductase-like glutaredoxin family protein